MNLKEEFAFNIFDAQYKDLETMVFVSTMDNKIAYANPAWLLIMGFSLEDIIGKNVFTTLIKMDEFTRTAWSGRARDKQGNSYRFDGTSKTTRIRETEYVLGFCKPEHCVFLAKNPMEEIEKYFHYWKGAAPKIITGFSDVTMLDEMPFGISVVIDDVMQYVYVNNHYCKKLGYSAKDFLSGRVKVNDITVELDTLSDNVVNFQDFQNGFNEDIYLEKKWMHAKGHLVEGRIMASKFQLEPGGLTYLISAISFRKGNKYKLHKTPTAIKRAAKLLNKTEQEIIECSMILQKEGLFTFDDDYPLKEYLQKTRKK